MKVKKVLEDLLAANQNAKVGLSSIWEKNLRTINSFKVSEDKIIFDLKPDGEIKTVKELVEILSKADQELNVFVSITYENNLYEFVEINIFKESVVIDTY